MEVRRIEIPNAILLEQVKEVVRNGKTATINVKGYSMRPFLDNSRHKVRLAQVGQLAVGDAIMAEVNSGVFVLHRIIAIEGDNITLMGDGNVRGTEKCTKDDVIGVVTHYIYEKKTVPATDKCLQRKVRIWRKLLPVRRYLLYIYKVGVKIKSLF